LWLALACYARGHRRTQAEANGGEAWQVIVNRPLGGVKGGMMEGMMEVPFVFQAFMWMIVLLLVLLFLGMAGWLIGQFIEWLGYQHWLRDLFKGE
jgi:hypothetical protein